MKAVANGESKVSRRLTEQTANEVCEVIYEPRMVGFNDTFPYLSQINKAHLLMLHAQKLIPNEASRSLAQSILAMEAEGPEVIELDPQREDAYFNYEAHLIGRTGSDVGGRLHTARSRNDILATIDRLSARDSLLKIMDALIAVRKTAAHKALAYKDVIMPGYTHLQPAQPITYGFYLAGIAQMLERDSKRFESVYERLNHSPLGAGAFAGTPFDIDRDLTASLLAFDGVVDNTLDAVASRDFMFELMSDITLLAATWSRIAQDYFVWSTDEFNLIEFPDSVAGTSSIMPQKKNPVVLEYLKGRAGKLLGIYTGAVAGIKGTNFSHTGDANRESISEFSEMIQDCLGSLELLELVLRTAQPNEANMLDRVSKNFCSATDLADLLVVKTDISFRESHHVVGAVVREAMDNNLPADQITIELVDKAYMDQIGRKSNLSQEEVTDSLNVNLSVNKRMAGGPSKYAVERTVKNLLATLEQDQKNNRARAQSVLSALEQLDQKVRELSN